MNPDFCRIADTVARVAELSPRDAEIATKVVLSFPPETLHAASMVEPRITDKQKLALDTMERRYDKEPMLTHTERARHIAVERKWIMRGK